MMQSPSKILVTGAAGIVGSALRPLLQRRHHQIVLSDIVQPPNLAANESYSTCRLEDLDQLCDLTAGVDAILHLGGMVGAHYTFTETLGPNIVGTHNLFEAARLNGIRRVVYASSHHAVGFMPRGSHIDDKTPPRPNSEYGLTKAYGEAAASYFADNFGLQILIIRIGYLGDEVNSSRRLRTWISARDLAQLVDIGFCYPDLHFEIVYGISQTPAPVFFDNDNAYRMGYSPEDRAIDQITDPSILDEAPDMSTIEQGVVGGGFASAGFAGNPQTVLQRK